MPVHVNVIGSMIFLIAVGLMAVNILYQSYRGKCDAIAISGAVRKAQLAEAT